MSDPLRERLLRLLFPHKCFCCTALLPDGGYLCPACAKTLPRIEPGRFPNLPPFVRVAAPLYYKDGVRQGIHRFKYDGRSYYAAFLAGLMAERLLEIPGLPRFDLLTYVPPAPHKLRQRGFCPAGMLAQQLSRRLKIRVRDGLIGHTENTVAQMTLSDRLEREANARQSFAGVRGVRLHGERILLVDDVLTPGSTARRCASLLARAGAGEIWMAAAAVVPHQEWESPDMPRFSEKDVERAGIL